MSSPQRCAFLHRQRYGTGSRICFTALALLHTASMQGSMNLSVQARICQSGACSGALKCSQLSALDALEQQWAFLSLWNQVTCTIKVPKITLMAKPKTWLMSWQCE